MNLVHPKKVALFTWVLTIITTPFYSIGATSEDDRMAQARAKASALGGSLKSALQTAIANGGVENGIVVCHEVAGSLAAKLSDENWQVGRTSLKVRNIKNTPEPWASANLQAFAEQLSAMPSRIPEVSYRDPQTGQFTYMRAIVTQPVCTACHGNDIQNNVMEKIQSLYPHDQATGFKTGDLRGAFIVTYTP